MARIVIAEDSIVMEAILQYLVERVGHTVVGIAKEGEKAVALYKSLQPDIVALDIFLKGSNGIAVLKEIKQENPAAKVIMLVAEDQDKEEAEAYQSGADGFLRKPFRLHAVEAELARVLESKAEDQQPGRRPAGR
jgi:two-component system, chemotaxis family, chemotaxis protein CheY